MITHSPDDGHLGDRLAALLDGSLPAESRHAVLAHLAACSRCREERSAAERARCALLRASDARMPADVADRMRERLREAAARRPGRAVGFRLGRLVAGVAAAGLALAAASALLGRNPRLHPQPVEEAPTPFERAAIEIFDQAESGGAPLQRRSGSPAELRRFVVEHTGLGVQLAPHRPAEDDGRFQAVGARTLLVEGARTAAVLYEVDGRPVVLLTAREGEVRERPSRWTPFGKDVSHRGVGGRQVLTWTNSGQVYTLVSRLPSHGSPGCLLCHTDARRRAQIRQIG